MFILRFDVESAYALNPSIESDENWQIWLEETLASVEQITRVLKRYDAPATFCIVGKVLERAGEDLAYLLKDNPLFDIASHTYSHMGISSTEPNVLRQFSTELEQTSDLILRYFGARPIC
jgi:peptidoglycan/xylan/chitin deacetylase (PgdA/CDA1 family)